jgi:hypothetical protein
VRQEAAALRDFNPLCVCSGSFSIKPPAASSPVMSAVPPIATEFCAPQRMAVSAKTRLVQCSKTALRFDHLNGTWYSVAGSLATGTGRPIQPPMLLWPKPLDLRLERGFDRPVRRLNGDHARPGIGNTASLADALDLRTLLREFASA